jgi:hypothetical protein
VYGKHKKWDEAVEHISVMKIIGHKPGSCLAYYLEEPSIRCMAVHYCALTPPKA